MSFADFFQATTGNLSYDYQSRLAGAIPVRNAILDGRPCAVAGEAAAS